MDYQVLLDTWEGNLEIDEPILLAAGVKGLIIRMNDINGGHHKDELFDKQWGEAARFIRWPYFVYNPWVSGVANYDWMSQHMPAGCNMVSPDIEVTYTGINQHDYGIQVADFVARTAKTWHTVKYTGAWFLPYLDQWPGGEYWWARYPGWLYPDQKTPLTWPAMITRLDATTWAPDYGTIKSPGPIMLWQCSADRYILPGCGPSPMDLDIFNGTLTQLEAWTGQKFDAPVSPPVELDDHTKIELMWNTLKAKGIL